MGSGTHSENLINVSTPPQSKFCQSGSVYRWLLCVVSASAFVISVHPGKHPGCGVGSLFYFLSQENKAGSHRIGWWLAVVWMLASLTVSGSFPWTAAAGERLRPERKSGWLAAHKAHGALSHHYHWVSCVTELLAWKRAGVGVRQGFLVTDANLIKPRRNVHGRYCPHPPLLWTAVGFASQEWLLVPLASALPPPPTWKCLWLLGPGMALWLHSTDDTARLKASLAS